MSTNKKTMSIEEKIFQLAEKKPFEDVSTYEKSDKYDSIVEDLFLMMKIDDDALYLIYKNENVLNRIGFKHLEFGYLGTVFMLYFDGKPFTYQLIHMTNERRIIRESFICDKDVFMEACDLLYKEVRYAVNKDVSEFIYYENKEESSYQPSNQELKVVGDELHMINRDDNTFVVCS